MEHRSKVPKKSRFQHHEGTAIGAVGLVFVALIVGLFFVRMVHENLGLEEKQVVLGATFSKPYAESLGLDWKQTYIASLDELKIRRFRIPAYWNDIEPSQDEWHFDNIDWQIAEADKRGAKVVLAIGRKLPRWPECHAPNWTVGMPESLVQTRMLIMIEKVVRRYSASDAVVMWQVENEPFFQFGECPPPNRELLKAEAAVVRALDKRPIMITESGELSSWVGVAGIADVLGISTYRTVWDKFVGYFYWPISPRFYTRRYATVSTLVQSAMISELQAEPWLPEGIDRMPVDEQLRLMNPARLQENVKFARQTGFHDAYLWGIEWWYWLKEKKSRPALWEEGRKVFLEASVALPPDER